MITDKDVNGSIFTLTKSWAIEHELQLSWLEFLCIICIGLDYIFSLTF
jgi:hypothetical protein